MHENGNVVIEGQAEIQERIERDLNHQIHTNNLETTLAAIVTFSTDAIYSVGPGHVILSWNGGAERLLGYRAEEVIGKPSPALTPEIQAQTDEILRRVLEGARQSSSNPGAGAKTVSCSTSR